MTSPNGNSGTRSGKILVIPCETPSKPRSEELEQAQAAMNNKPFKCRICGKGYRNVNMMHLCVNLHLRTARLPKEK